MTTEAREITDSEYAASAVSYVDPSEINDLMGVSSTDRDEAMSGVRPVRVRLTDRIVLYHPDPDHPSSVYIVPMNSTERRMVIGRYLQKTKMVMGKQVRWNFPRPQVEPTALPLRCFITGCDRRGGFSSRAQLIGHVMGKHTNEAPMYQRIIDALMEQIWKDIPASQYAELGIAAPEDLPEMVRETTARKKGV